MNTKKYHGLVNRKRVIATLEDKANVTGFRWTRPKKLQNGFVENRSKKGKFLHFSLVKPVSILDVDGREKVTIKTLILSRIKRHRINRLLLVYGRKGWLARITAASRETGNRTALRFPILLKF